MIRLGLKYANGSVTGAIARCVAFVEAVREVLGDFECDKEKSFGSEWNAHLSKAVNFLVECRPLSFTMGNAISHLKRHTGAFPQSMPHDRARCALVCASI